MESATEWKWFYLQKDNYNFYVDRSSSQYLNFWQKKEDFTEIMNWKIGWAFHNPVDYKVKCSLNVGDIVLRIQRPRLP